ncbi:MAG: Swt1 family HEPN domain-containing protein [Desulfobaccales bacterium]
MEFDITQTLKDTENALRDFIASILHNKFGEKWAEKSGLSPERIKKWQDRKAEEEKRQKFGTVEERLIYYADFYDLETILQKNWDGEFKEALGDWKTIKVWLDELGKLRDPEAHRRELLPHQKHLALGIAGEIRTRLVRYRSKQETSEDYYAKIESARDSFGNIITPGRPGDKYCHPKTKLRPGDSIDFVVTASDPLEEELGYIIIVDHEDSKNWQKDNSFSIKISEKHVKKYLSIELRIRSPRKYHPFRDYDESVEFIYEVLPPKTK